MDLQEVADEAARVLGAPVTLEDRAFRLLAFSSHDAAAAQADDVRLATVLRRGSPPQVRAWFEQFGIATSDGPVRTPASAELSVRARVCVPLREAGVTYGYLWVADLGQDDAQLARVAVPAAAAAAQLARGARSARLVEERLLAVLGDDPQAAERAAAELIAAGRLETGVPVRVVVLAQQAATTLPAATLRADLDGRCVVLAQRLAGLRVRGRAPTPATTAGLDLTGTVAGVGSAGPIEQAPTSLAQALVALQVAQAVPSVGAPAVWDELGAYRLLAVAGASQLRDTVLDPPLRRLLADPTLRTTATAYLDAAGSPARTAAALHLHRQTLYYRLRRIEELTGLDLDDGEDRLRLHLGLVLSRMIEP